MKTINLSWWKVSFSIVKNYNIFTKRFAELLHNISIIYEWQVILKNGWGGGHTTYLFPKVRRYVPTELKGNLSVMQRCLPIIYWLFNRYADRMNTRTHTVCANSFWHLSEARLTICALICRRSSRHKTAEIFEADAVNLRNFKCQNKTNNKK